jgi:hypothetical protein
LGKYIFIISKLEFISFLKVSSPDAANAIFPIRPSQYQPDNVIKISEFHHLLSDIPEKNLSA